MRGKLIGHAQGIILAVGLAIELERMLDARDKAGIVVRI